MTMMIFRQIGSAVWTLSFLERGLAELVFPWKELMLFSWKQLFETFGTETGKIDSGGGKGRTPFSSVARKGLKWDLVPKGDLCSFLFFFWSRFSWSLGESVLKWLEESGDCFFWEKPGWLTPRWKRRAHEFLWDYDLHVRNCIRVICFVAAIAVKFGTCSCWYPHLFFWQRNLIFWMKALV